jgi:hypothetical protein
VAEIAYRRATAQVRAGESNILAKPVVAVPMALICLPFGGSGAIIQYWKRIRAARRVMTVSESNLRETDAQPPERNTRIS